MVRRPVAPRSYAEYVADTLMGRLLRRDLAAIIAGWGVLLALAGTVGTLLGAQPPVWVAVGIVVAGGGYAAYRRFHLVLHRDPVPVATAGGHGVRKDPNRFGNVSLYFLLAVIVAGGAMAWPRLEPASRPAAVVALVAMAAFVASLQIPAIRRERTKFAAVEARLAAHPELAATYRENLRRWDGVGGTENRQRRRASRKRRSR